MRENGEEPRTGRGNEDIYLHQPAPEPASTGLKPTEGELKGHGQQFRILAEEAAGNL